jgi:hypothetical protein
MAYSTTNPPRLIAQSVGAAGGALWLYSDGDGIETVIGADYFSNGDALGMEVNDVVLCVDSTDDVVNVAMVSAVTSGGAATVVTKLSQELTATGAVNPGVKSVELNHATVVVEATIADAANHQGLFVAKDTSASGTAAHTLTLTSGTFDGTNNVATFNAPNEALVVWFDSAGNGTIVENVGSVALS